MNSWEILREIPMIFRTIEAKTMFFYGNFWADNQLKPLLEH